MTQRAIAVGCAHRAYVEAPLSDVDWVRPALAALDSRARLPPPFDDLSEAFARPRADPRVPRTTIAAYDGRHDRVSQQHAAVPALPSAADRDYPRLLRDLRVAFDLPPQPFGR